MSRGSWEPLSHQIDNSDGFRGGASPPGGLKKNKNVSSPSTCESQYCWSFRDREVACSASDRQGSNFESCVWRTVSSQSSHHPQEVLLAQFSLYVHKGGLKPDSFHFPPPFLVSKTKKNSHISAEIWSRMRRPNFFLILKII